MTIESLEARVLFSVPAPPAAILPQPGIHNDDLARLVMEGGGKRNRAIDTAGVIFPSLSSVSGPLSAVVGGALRGRLSVGLENQADIQEKGTVVLNVYASDNGQFDSGDPLVDSVSRQINLAAGASAHVSITLNKVLPGTLGLGTDTLILEAVDPAGNSQVNLTGGSFTYAQPRYSLSESFGKAPPPAVVSSTKTTAAIQLEVTDNGNVPLAGPCSISLSLSPVATSAPGTLVITVKRNLTIRLGQTGQVNVPLQSIPALASGSYYFVATVTDPLGQATTAESSFASVVAAPLVSLSETFTGTTLPTSIVGGIKTSAAATLLVTNLGNIVPPGPVTIDLFASANQSIIGATMINSVTRTLNVQPGASIRVAMPLGTLANLAPGKYYLLAQVTDSTGGTSLAATASPLTVAAPFISLSPTFSPLTLAPAVVAGSTIKNAAVVSIKNNGNIPCSGLIVNVLASTTGQLSGAKSFDVVKSSVVIPPGAARSVKLPLAALSSLADGAYFIVAEVTNSSGGISIATSTSSITVAAPFVSLGATIDSAPSPITLSEEGIVNFTVTNNGNIPTGDAAGGEVFQVVLDLLGEDGLPDSLGAANFTQKMVLAPGASKNLFAGFAPTSIPTPLQQGTYIPRLTISIEGTTYTTTVTGNAFPITISG